MGAGMITRRMAMAGGAGAAVLAALGYRAWDRGMFSAGEGAAFDPWRDWQGTPGEGIRRPLHAAILAANPHDTQPWLFSAGGDTITVWADRARNLGSFDPFRREMHLGLGCAIANLRFAAASFGLFADVKPIAGRLTLSPPNTPAAVARIKMSPLPAGSFLAKHLPRTVAAIAARRTNRGPYLRDKPVPSALLDAWPLLGGGEGPRVVFIADDARHAAMRDIMIAATEAIVADPEMSADSARWFRTGRDEIEAHRDGVTMDTAGLSPWLLAAAKLLPDVSAKTADESWLTMTKDTQTATAPVFGMILVRDRLDVAQTLCAGQLWQTLHLMATDQGIAAQPINQPVEMIDRNAQLGRPDRFGPALGKLANMPGWEPTFTFRMGYAEHPAPHSPRRPLSAVIRA